ncbi:MAG: YdeI/OmpD-associated family protein, partial [Flavobacteriales bacterium]
AMAAAFKHHCEVWFFDGAQDIPREDVLAYLREAMANAEEGKRVAPPPRPQRSPDWCPALAAAFESEPEFQAAMLALTPGRQREYNDHVGSAKREVTQLARLDKVRPLVLAGKGLHDKYRK